MQIYNIEKAPPADCSKGTIGPKTRAEEASMEHFSDKQVFFEGRPNDVAAGGSGRVDAGNRSRCILGDGLRTLSAGSPG